MMVHQDLIIRFESYFLPYVDDIHEGRKGSCLWRNLDNKKARSVDNFFGYNEGNFL